MTTFAVINRLTVTVQRTPRQTHSLVRQMLHEHAAALSAASPANRSRRLIECAKESARYLNVTCAVR